LRDFLFRDLGSKKEARFAGGVEVGAAGERSRAEPGALQLPQAGQAGWQDRRRRRRNGRSEWSAKTRCVLHMSCLVGQTHGSGKETEGGR
jgi:hypothetical protein